MTLGNSLLVPFKLNFTILIIFLHYLLATASLCRNYCNNIPINYPFGIDDGCGAPQFRRMLNCSATDLFFLTPSGSYKVQTIDYNKKTVVLFDPSMSTCSILQPHHDFVMTDIQSAIIPPSPDTVFVLMNCSIDSPVLNHYRSLCFNFSGHSCDELYASCTSFKLFHILSNTTPPCCFTTYGTVKFMSMNILDCTHYTSVYNVDALKGVGPLDWLYGIKLSYSLPDLGCVRCAKSGGTCGFDVETEAFVCICSPTNNATRDCGGAINGGKSYGAPNSLLGVFVLFLRAIFSL
ncbi:hypothetical protein CDL12_04035 [Handroanthus impetiginosus]|uniref:non-specific serine/threonine protein kinase n=1 Tax=Handroanthus impetiginosus TaxID=429701 RepID=A0A2G9I0H2_9LAMI|nr:hypothetical protein CDL12_04035 [Handroanthus impetiginosus]